MPNDNLYFKIIELIEEYTDRKVDKMRIVFWLKSKDRQITVEQKQRNVLRQAKEILRSNEDV